MRRTYRVVGLCLIGITSPLAHALPQVAITLAPEFPHIAAGEVDFIYNPKWTLGANAGGFAHTFNSSSGPIPVSIGAGNVKFRWAPFSGTFFLGLAAGLQKISASGTRTFTVTDSSSGQSVAIPASASLGVTSPYVTPHFGWFVVTRWGFTFGLELGVQVPIRSSSDLELQITDPALNGYLQLVQDTQLYKDTRAQIESQIGQFANILLPHAAIRLGWTF